MHYVLKHNNVTCIYVDVKNVKEDAVLHGEHAYITLFQTVPYFTVKSQGRLGSSEHGRSP